MGKENDQVEQSHRLFSLEGLAAILFLVLFILPLTLFFLYPSTGEQWIKYLGVIIWPLVVITVIYIFRQQIPELIARATKVSAAGVSIELEQQLKQTEELKADRDNLQKDNLDNKTLKYAQELHFERAYRIIFNTQLQALIKLSNYSKGLSESDFFDLLGLHQTFGHPELNYTTVLDWMNFLVVAGFVDYDPIRKVYSIIDLGTHFLNYLITQRIPLSKPGNY